MYKNDKVIRRYSEPFKLKILDELTTGKLNKSQLGKLYGINPTTISDVPAIILFRAKKFFILYSLPYLDDGIVQYKL